MNSKNKRNVIIVAIILIVVIAVIAIIIRKPKAEETGEPIQQEEYTIQNANGNKVNTSEALKTPRKELEYYASNITLQKQDAQTIFKLQLTNQGTTDIAGQLVDIVFVGENGQEEARMALYIREIKAGQSIQTQATINNDFTNVYNFKLEKRTAN